MRYITLSDVMMSEKHRHQSSTATVIAAISTPYHSASSVTGLPFMKKRGVAPLCEKRGLVSDIIMKSGG